MTQKILRELNVQSVFWAEKRCECLENRQIPSANTFCKYLLQIPSANTGSRYRQQIPAADTGSRYRDEIY